MILRSGEVFYCMWVSRDPEDPAEGGRPLANMTLASSFNSTMESAALTEEVPAVASTSQVR